MSQPTGTVRVLCRPAAGAGFRLAGIPTIEAADPDEGARRLGTLLDDNSVGVVLLEQAIHDALPDSIRRGLARRLLPMVVPFPGPDWSATPGQAEAFITDLLRQAIGYRVRLR